MAYANVITKYNSIKNPGKELKCMERLFQKETPKNINSQIFDAKIVDMEFFSDSPSINKYNNQQRMKNRSNFSSKFLGNNSVEEDVVTLKINPYISPKSQILFQSISNKVNKVSNSLKNNRNNFLNTSQKEYLKEIIPSFMKYFPENKDYLNQILAREIKKSNLIQNKYSMNNILPIAKKPKQKVFIQYSHKN